MTRRSAIWIGFARGGRLRCRPLFPVCVAAGVLVVCMVLTGCGAGDGGETTVPPFGTSLTTVTYAFPGGPRDVVVRVEHGGGLVPAAVSFAEVPVLSVLGDGTVITRSPETTSSAPPALPGQQVARLNREAMQQLLSTTYKAGLFSEGVDYGSPSITDAAVTSFTVSANGQTRVTRVYALGMGGPELPGLTDQQRKARQALVDFQARVDELLGSAASYAAPAKAYVPEAVAVLIMPAAGNRPGASASATSTVEWPLGDLATLGEPSARRPPGAREVVIQGAPLQRLIGAAGHADAQALWESGGAQYRLAFRPLLPDQVPRRQAAEE